VGPYASISIEPLAGKPTPSGRVERPRAQACASVSLRTGRLGEPPFAAAAVDWVNGQLTATLVIARLSRTSRNDRPRSPDLPYHHARSSTINARVSSPLCPSATPAPYPAA
jgi:hypothetical protein